VGCSPRDRHPRRRVPEERGNENVPLCLAGIRQRLPLVAGDKRLMRTSPVIAPRHLTNSVAIERETKGPDKKSLVSRPYERTFAADWNDAVSHAGISFFIAARCNAR